MFAAQDGLGVLLRNDALIEGKHYRIEMDTFHYAVQSIRNTILHNAPSSFNLVNLSVSLDKPNQEPWVYMAPHVIDNLIPEEVKQSGDCSNIDVMQKRAFERFVDKPLFMTMRIAFEYLLPDSQPPA